MPKICEERLPDCVESEIKETKDNIKQFYDAGGNLRSVDINRLGFINPEVKQECCDWSQMREVGNYKTGCGNYSNHIYGDCCQHCGKTITISKSIKNEKEYKWKYWLRH